MNDAAIGSPRFWTRGLVPLVLIGVGLLHTVVGLSAGRTLLAGIASEGFWDTVHSGPEPISRSLLLWFLASGFFLVMLGHLALWVERRVGQPLPFFLGVELLLFAIVFGVVKGGALPAWLFAAVGTYILLVACAARREERG